MAYFDSEIGMIDLKSEEMPQQLKQEVKSAKVIGWTFVVLGLLAVIYFAIVFGFASIILSLGFSVPALAVGIPTLVIGKKQERKYYAKRSQLLEKVKNGELLEEQNQQIYMDPALGPIDLASTELPPQIRKNMRLFKRCSWFSTFFAIFLLISMRDSLRDLDGKAWFTFLFMIFTSCTFMWCTKKQKENYYKKRTEIIEKVKQGKIDLKEPEKQRNWEHHMCCNVCGTIFVYTDDDMANNASHKFHSIVSSLFSAINAQTGNRYDMYEQRKIADREENQIRDYSRCPIAIPPTL